MSEQHRGPDALRDLLYETLQGLRIETTPDDIDVLADAVEKSAWLCFERAASEANAFAFTNQIRADAKARRPTTNAAHPKLCEDAGREKGEARDGE